jgi:hypothetical protein
MLPAGRFSVDANRAIRRIFEFPCRFPAAPSIRPKRRVQGFDSKRFLDTGRTSKKFLP